MGGKGDIPGVSDNGLTDLTGDSDMSVFSAADRPTDFSCQTGEVKFSGFTGPD